ncbi:MAG: hypothetical protein J6W64_06450 [Bacilli bacterium]|nr:hypothetical protein [Bacilli bacterium]
MDIQWFSKSPKGVATIYDNNITLNTVATNHFKNSYGILIGYAEESKILLLKSITKEDLAMGLYQDLDIHSISIKPSYGRITGKNVIKKLTSLFPINFSDSSLNKFECEWSTEDKTLKVYLERRVN